MPTATLTISDEVKENLKRFSWINWSEVAREAFLEKLRRDKVFKRFDEVLKNSKMTEELASKLADKLKRRVAKRHGL